MYGSTPPPLRGGPQPRLQQDWVFEDYSLSEKLNERREPLQRLIKNIKILQKNVSKTVSNDSYEIELIFLDIIF